MISLGRPEWQHAVTYHLIEGNDMCIKIRTLAVALLAVTVAGCGAGGNGSGGAAPAGGGASTNPAPAVQKDEALAKLVPSDIASDGKIVVG